MATIADSIPQEQLAELRQGGTDELDISSATIEELREELRERVAFALEITDSLAADALNSYALGHARRYQLSQERADANREARNIRSELRRRAEVRIIKEPQSGPTRETRRAEQIAFEKSQQAASAAKRAEKAARHAVNEAANQDLHRMFVRAAFRVLGKEKFDAIWLAAREMFPNEPAWKLRPDLPAANASEITNA